MTLDIAVSDEEMAARKANGSQENQKLPPATLRVTHLW